MTDATPAGYQIAVEIPHTDRSPPPGRLPLRVSSNPDRGVSEISQSCTDAGRAIAVNSTFQRNQFAPTMAACAVGEEVEGVPQQPLVPWCDDPCEKGRNAMPAWAAPYAFAFRVGPTHVRNPASMNLLLPKSTADAALAPSAARKVEPRHGE